jgi:aminoglycoside phosphotransferase (APT) family kinase protein
LARDLAELVLALRALPVPAEAAADPALRWYRAEPVTDLDTDVRENLARCRELGVELDLDGAAEVWDDVMTRSRSADAGPLHWLHGDLLGENLLVRDERLCALLDLGGLAVGDAAVDLVCAWELLDPPPRRLFRELVGVPDDVWLRGRGWALALALMTFPYYGRTMPQRCADRLALGRAAIAGL